MPDPNRPDNDPVMHPDAQQPRNKDREADEASSGMLALAGLGCLGFTVLPWLIAGGIIVFLLLLGIFFQSCAVTG